MPFRGRDAGFAGLLKKNLIRKSQTCSETPARFAPANATRCERRTIDEPSLGQVHATSSADQLSSARRWLAPMDRRKTGGPPRRRPRRRPHSGAGGGGGDRRV